MDAEAALWFVRIEIAVDGRKPFAVVVQKAAGDENPIAIPPFG